MDRVPFKFVEDVLEDLKARKSKPEPGDRFQFGAIPWYWQGSAASGLFGLQEYWGTHSRSCADKDRATLVSGRRELLQDPRSAVERTTQLREELQREQRSQESQRRQEEAQLQVQRRRLERNAKERIGSSQTEPEKAPNLYLTPFPVRRRALALVSFKLLNIQLPTSVQQVMMPRPKFAVSKLSRTLNQRHIDEETTTDSENNIVLETDPEVKIVHVKLSNRRPNPKLTWI
uniref:UBX domain-containing protein n=1 Tax=Steinernema glaseri TaxID=37863 RepID=A0A1I7Z895_9BILA